MSAAGHVIATQGIKWDSNSGKIQLNKGTSSVVLSTKTRVQTILYILIGVDKLYNAINVLTILIYLFMYSICIAHYSQINKL